MESWIIDPFKFIVDKLPDGESYKEGLIDLKESRNMKMKFELMVLENFWSAGLEHIQSWQKKHEQFSFLSRLLIHAKPDFLPWLI